MGYTPERGYFKKVHTMICKSDKCGKPFTTTWKQKQYCSSSCRLRGAYIVLKAKQQAEGKNTRRISISPGVRLGLTPEETREWQALVRRENNRLKKKELNARCKADPLFGWEKRIKEKYKITRSDYETMLQSQNYGCLFCGKQSAHEDTQFLHIDHCHATGKVRGLLCFNCNAMLGHAKDNIATLRKAAEYLEKHNGVVDRQIENSYTPDLPA